MKNKQLISRAIEKRVVADPGGDQLAVEDVGTTEDILMLLGLKEGADLSVLSSLKHPLGVIKINRDETSLKFRLEELTDENDSGETLQAGEVRWTQTVSDDKELPEIKIPGSDSWKELSSRAEETVWQGEPGNYYILQKYTTPRALPLDDLNDFRAYARKQAKAISGGLVEARFVQCDGHKAAYYIVKNTYKDLMGYRYIGRCVIPVEGGAYEIRMDTLPVGVTGRREALLNIKLGLLTNLRMEKIPDAAPPTPGNPPSKPGDERIKGIFKDPYDAKFDATANYSVTDDAKYDAQFPQHPLSRLRDKFPKLIEAINIDSDETGSESASSDAHALIDIGQKSQSMPRE